MKRLASRTPANQYSWLLTTALWFIAGLFAVSIVALSGRPAHAAPPPTDAQKASFMFQGRVYDGDVGDQSHPLEGVSVSLFGAGNPYPAPGQLIATTTTDGEGWYGLTGDEGWEYYSIREDNPSGYVSVGATSVDGTVRDADWIEYAIPLDGLTLTGNKFWDSSGATPTPSPTPTTPTPTPTPATPTPTPSPTTPTPTPTTPTPTPTPTTPTPTPTLGSTSTPTPVWTPTPTPTPGGVVNLTVCAVADAEIDQAQPDANMGDAIDLTAGYGQGANEPYANRILLQFELDFVPPGTEVVDAFLEMRMYAADGANPATISVYRIDDMWDEMAVTWNSRPVTDTHPASQETVDLAVPNIRGWNLQALVQQWVEGSIPNLGIEIRGSEGGSSWSRSFDARHHTVFCPRLVLTLNATGTIPTPTPTPTATPTATPPSACPHPDAGGDSFSAASPMTAGVEVKEYICPSGDVDWFKVPVEAPQEISVYLYDLPLAPPADLDVYLYDPTGAEVGSSEIFGADKGGYINRTAFRTGDYRVMVRGKGPADWSPTKTYGLRVDLKFNCDFEDEAGDTFQAATEVLPSITVGNTIRKHTGYICPQGDIDFYKFYVPYGQEVTANVKLTDLPADFDLDLYRPNGDLYTISRTSGTADEEVSVVATHIHGYWRVSVKSPDGGYHNRPYTLEVILTGDADFTVEGMEVTQGIQDLGNNVTLAAGKTTVARVYINPGTAVTETSGVEVALHGSYYSWGFKPFPDSPLTLGPMEVTDKTLENTKRLFARQSFNFDLPKSWTTAGDLTLRATVNPRRSIPESNFSNNDLTDTIKVRNVRPLNIGLVPIKTKGLVPTLPNNPDLASMLTWLRASYPVGQVNIWHMVGTYEMDYDLTERSEEGCGPGWVDLLADLGDRYDGWTNRPPNAVVYGLLKLGVPVGTGACGSPDLRSAGGFLDPTSGDVIAHEIGHVFFRKHAPSDRDAIGTVINLDCSDPGTYSEDLSYPQYMSPTGAPYHRSSIGEVGFDVFKKGTYNPSHHYDFMSYCGPEWVSPYTWDRIAYAMPTAPKTTSAESDSRQVLVSGVVIDDQCDFRPFFWVRERSTQPDKVDQTGPYTIELRDASGAVIGSCSFDTYDPVAGVDRAKGLFREWMAWPEGVATIALVFDGADIAVREVSARSPTVTLVSPNGGEFWEQSGTARIEWHAEDDDVLAANIFISSDDGVTWAPLAMNQLNQFYDLDLSTVPGGDAMRVKVEVSDGVNTTSDVSDTPFGAEEKAPIPLLFAPEAGRLVRRGEGVAMVGDGLDLQAGTIDSENLSWFSSIDGFIGKSADIAATDLYCGAHEIALEVLGENGIPGVKATDITVHGGCEDLVYVLPASAHVEGLQGTSWVSDVVLHNPGPSVIKAILYLLDDGVTVEERFHVEVPAGSSVLLADLLAENFGPDAKAGGVLIGSNGPLILSSRTYNDAESGTFGQFVPVEDESAAVVGNEPATLIQLTRNDDFRTNIGFTNLGWTQLDIVVEVFTASGTYIGSKGLSVDPYSSYQVTDILRKVGAEDVDDAFAVVRARNVDAAYFTYASIIDNRTGDPIYASPTKSSTTPIYIAAAAHLRGANRTNWRTDLEIFNSGATQAWYQLDLLERGKDNTNPRSAIFLLDAGKSIRYEDVLDTVFSYSGAAALRITPIAGEIAATSRTFNLLDTGTTGQFAPSIPGTEAIESGESARLIQLSQSSRSGSGYRTNIGFTSLSSRPSTVDVELFEANGEFLGRVTVDLGPFEYTQIDKIFKKVTANAIDHGYAVIRSESEGARFLAYASVIDNRSSDPIYIPARVWADQTVKDSALGMAAHP